MIVPSARRLSLSRQTFPHVVLLALFAFGRTLFLTGEILGGQVNWIDIIMRQGKG